VKLGGHRDGGPLAPNGTEESREILGSTLLVKGLGVIRIIRGCGESVQERGLKGRRVGRSCRPDPRSRASARPSGQVEQQFHADMAWSHVSLAAVVLVFPAKTARHAPEGGYRHPPMNGAEPPANGRDGTGSVGHATPNVPLALT